MFKNIVMQMRKANCEKGYYYVCGFSRVPLRGSTIGLAGCGIWLIFVAIFGMGTENGSGKREFQLRAVAGFCVKKGSGCKNRKGRVAGYGITVFTRLHDLTSSG